MTAPAVSSPAAASGGLRVPTGHYRFSGLLRSEWTKLRTVRSTLWSLVATVVAVVGIGAIATAVTGAHWQTNLADHIGFDPTRRSLAGLFLGQMAIGVLGVLAVSAEYSTGTIRATLAAAPRRPEVLAAKVVVFGAVALVVSEVLSFAAFFLGQALLHPAPSATIGQPGVARAVVGTGLSLAVLGLFALGLGTILRHTAGSIFAYVGVLLVFPLILQAFPTSLQHALLRYMPLLITQNMAGTHADVRDFGGAPLFGAWAGFGVLVAYTVALLVVGGVLLQRRDA